MMGGGMMEGPSAGIFLGMGTIWLLVIVLLVGGVRLSRIAALGSGARLEASRDTACRSGTRCSKQPAAGHRSARWRTAAQGGRPFVIQRHGALVFIA